MEGILHVYQAKPPLNLFEYTTRPSSTAPCIATSSNVLLFIGGLYDNFSSPEYLVDLVNLFPRHQSQQWTLMHAQLSSAIRGFGTSDLDQDIRDIALAVSYIRDVIRKGEATNIVLLGQSTGCQDVLHYVCAPFSDATTRPTVQGIILQAPVSDRDGLRIRKLNVDAERKRDFDRCMSLVATIPESRHKAYMLPLDWTMPLFGRAPLCISRFLDLTSPSSPEYPRAEDLFSTDLPPSRLNETFGKVGQTGVLKSSSRSTTDPCVLVLISELDTDILRPFNADDMLSRWADALSQDSAHPVQLHLESKMIVGATHDISGNDIRAQRAKLVLLRKALLSYLDDTVGGVDEFAWHEWKKDVDRIGLLERDSKE